MRAQRASKPFDINDHMAGTAGMTVAAANVILQLGSPGVGYGVVESTVDTGNVLLHPWKRLRTTLSYLVVALFGTEKDVAAYRAAVNRVHARVHSGPDSPVAYNAFDVDLQLWVAACLYVGFRDARVWFLGPLDPASEEELYQYCSRLGTSLQVPPEAWPADRAAFETYWADGLARVRYDGPVREHLLKVVDLRMLPGVLRYGNARLNRFITVGALPGEVRTAMQLDWSPRDQRRFDRLVTALRVVTRLTPRWARVLPIRLQLAEVRWRMRTDRRLV